MFAFISGLLSRQAMVGAGVFASAGAFKIGMLTLMVGAFTALIVAVNAAAALAVVVFPSWAAAGASWVVPSNFDVCFGAYVTGRMAIALYRWHKVWLGNHSPSPLRYA